MQANQTGIFYMGSTQTVLRDFPKEFRSSFASRFDRRFVIILAACALVLGTVTLVMSLRAVPTVATDKQILQIQERYAQLVLNQPKPAVEEEAPQVQEAAAEAGAAEEVEEVDRSKETFQEKTERKARSSDQRRKVREAVSRKVQSSGIFAAITATGGSGSGVSSGMTDFLGSAGAVGSLDGVDIGSGTFASKNTPGSSEIASRRGARTTGVGIKKGAVGTAQGTQLASAGSVNITTKPAEMKAESGAQVSNKACIQRVINRQKRRIVRSYENWLKRDPELSGQITVRFIILPGGAVSNVSVVKSTTNNSRFDQTIVNYIKGWKFDACSIGESVEIVFPFAFAGSS